MELPLDEHLEELRRRLIIVISFLAVFFVIGFSFSGHIIRWMIASLIFIENVTIIGLTPVEYIVARAKVALLVSFAISLPLIIYHAIAFIRPGLNRKEKEGIRLMLPAFVLLFIMGFTFAYFMFLPAAVYFLGRLSMGIIENLWSVDKFIGFVLLSCLSFGLIFQLPLLLMLLDRAGIVEGRWLRRYRPHAYVLIFLLAAVITPPDFITQLIIGLPLVLMYEISLLMIH
ncbi:twin-arginine translocase subunit TatC [Candidatus Woesearchaeota archaeon]|nr:twin-arginine translocase subunit TatC [Candidatus Woesearchaeota archaeon]